MKIWNEWVFLEELGKGTYGTVYKAYKKENNKTIYSAIKHISLPKTQKQIEKYIKKGYIKTIDDIVYYYKEVIECLIKEIEITKELKNKNNIVNCEEYLIKEKENGELGYDIYIRMELLTSLNKYISKNKITEKDVIKIGKDISHALQICNEHNIIHRDVKTSNIFIDEFGNYKLGDFGIAQKTTNIETKKRGSYNFMSPEMYKQEKIDISNDIYSLGIVMYRLLNNKNVPFIDKNTIIIDNEDEKKAFEKRIKGEEVPNIEGVNKELMNIVKKACAYNKQERYQTPQELLEDLNKIQGE